MLTEGANEVKLLERTLSITRVKVMGWMKTESDDRDRLFGRGRDGAGLVRDGEDEKRAANERYRMKNNATSA